MFGKNLGIYQPWFVTNDLGTLTRSKTARPVWAAFGASNNNKNDDDDRISITPHGTEHHKRSPSENTKHSKEQHYMTEDSQSIV